MKRISILKTAILALLAPAGAASAAAAPADSSLVLVVEVGSRLYPEWHEEVRVRLGETFFLGDSEFTARLRRFVPDFRISDTGEIGSASRELANPAARVVVYHDTTATDSSWAFLNFPPHFSPRSFFTFKLKEIHGDAPPEGATHPAAPGSGRATAAADTLPQQPSKERHD